MQTSKKKLKRYSINDFLSRFLVDRFKTALVYLDKHIHQRRLEIIIHHRVWVEVGITKQSSRDVLQKEILIL